MRDHYTRDRGRPDPPPAAPSACPACRSSDITTMSKVVTPESYWRCRTCGEVWNVARRNPSRYSTPGSYRS